MWTTNELTASLHILAEYCINPIYNQNTYWEGGIRVPAMVYSPLFDPSITGQSNDCLFHISDWFSTILGFAGNTADLGVDGVDQWEAISSMGASCPRK